MWLINNNGFYIALLELSPLKTLLYSTTLSHTLSIIFFKVPIFPSSYNIRERPLKVLPNIINIKKKHTAAFNISLFILQDHPITPCTRPPIKPSHETAICGNVPQFIIFYQVIEFY